METVEETEANILKAYQEQVNAVITLVSEYEGSREQLKRVLINLAVYPFVEEAELHFSYPEEKQLFDSFNSLSSAKHVFMLAGSEAEDKLVLVGPDREIIKNSDGSVLVRNKLNNNNEGEVNETTN